MMYNVLYLNIPIYSNPIETDDINKWIKVRASVWDCCESDYSWEKVNPVFPIEESNPAKTNPKQAYGDKKVGLQWVPPALLIAAGQAFVDGKKKYGAFNWRDKPVEVMTYVGAMLRHTLAYLDGEDIDPESGNPHLSGVVASAGILLDSLAAGTLIDNRPIKGTAGQKIRDLANAK